MSTNNGSTCPTYAIEHASRSDTGMRRPNNQDALAVIVTQDVATWAARGHLLIVADGMGAHAAGELASQLAVDNIPHAYFKRRDLYPPAALREAIRDANMVIHAKGQSSIGFQGMGTTCSCLVLLPQGALVAHIGDSRVYRLRGSVLEQLTFDHSLVWEMAAAGHMPQEDVPAYIPKNIITRSLGPHPTVHIDLEGPYDVAAGDVFLLCSDGLSGPVSDTELGAILQCLPPQEAAQTLVDVANLRGGPDNISVVVARMVDNCLPELPRNDVSGELAPPPTRPARQRAADANWGWVAAALWIATGACVGVLLYCLAYQMWPGAIIAAVAMAGALVSALVFRARRNGTSAAARALGGPYGNGPYRKAECEPNDGIVNALDEMAAKLRELPQQQPGEWEVNWQLFDEQRSSAAAAAQKGQYGEAVRRHSQAIRDIMRQLREHRPLRHPDAKAVGPDGHAPLI